MTDLSIHKLHDPIVTYLHETMWRFPPSHAPGMLAPSAMPYRIGEQLINLGYLLPHEVTSARSISQRKTSEPALPFGYTLINNKRIAVPVLTSALLLQILERLEHNPALPPRFLGEQLLVDNYLSPTQLAQVLEEQIKAHQRGKHIRLGNLITEHGWLDQNLLTQEVEQLLRH